MNTLKSKLRVNLIEVPNLNRSEFVELPTADFSSTKSSVNLQRAKLGRLVASKNITNVALAAQLGVKSPILKKFIQGIAIKSVDANIIATKIVNVINSNDIPKNPKTIKKEVSVSTINKSEFKGDEKGKIRDLYVSHLIKYGIKKTGKFFSLPSSGCQFEIQLNTEMDNSFKYDIVELFPNIYKEMLEMIVSKNIKTSSINLCDSKEVILSKKSNTYSHIFADWCKTYSTHESEVRHIIFNNLVEVGGLIGFTFCLRDEKGKDFHKTLLKDPKMKYGLNIDPNVKDGIYLKFVVMCYNKYEIVEFESYKDGSPMLFVLIKRLR